MILNRPRAQHHFEIASKNTKICLEVMFVIYESSAAFRIRDIKDENSIIIFEQS